MDHTMWNSMKCFARKWCRKLFAVLFVATCALGEMIWLLSEVVDSTVLVILFAVIITQPIENWKEFFGQKNKTVDVSIIASITFKKGFLKFRPEL